MSNNPYPSPVLYPSTTTYPRYVANGDRRFAAHEDDLLSYLPYWLTKSYEVQAVLHAAALEIDRLEAAIDRVLANSFVVDGLEYLHSWELLLGLPVDPFVSVEVRRTAILSSLRSLADSGSGLSWESRIMDLLGTSWTYSEHVPGDASTPIAYTLNLSIPPVVVPAPKNLVGVISTTGGTLPAANYLYAVTALSLYGESTISNEIEVAAVGGTSQVTLTWNASSNASGYRVYRGKPYTGQLGTNRSKLGQMVPGGGYSYERQIGSTTTALTFVDTGLPLGPASPPIINTTLAPLSYTARRIARQITPAHIRLDEGYIA